MALLTKFEFVRLVGLRARQLENPLFGVDDSDYIGRAKRDIICKTHDIVLLRRLPNETIVIHPNDMIVPEQFL